MGAISATVGGPVSGEFYHLELEANQMADDDKRTEAQKKKGQGGLAVAPVRLDAG